MGVLLNVLSHARFVIYLLVLQVFPRKYLTNGFGSGILWSHCANVW